LDISQNSTSEFHDFLGAFTELKEAKWTYIILGEEYTPGHVKLGDFSNRTGAINSDSIKLFPTVEWPSQKLNLPYKKAFFRNDNQLNGKLSYVIMELTNPRTDKDYHLFRNTCYSYHLTISEWFSK
jgi:hypothetical protein